MSMLVEMPQLICELESHYWEIISLHASCLLTKILAFTLVFVFSSFCQSSTNWVTQKNKILLSCSSGG